MTPLDWFDVTDKRFAKEGDPSAADPTGKHDSSYAIQAAINKTIRDQENTNIGGTVYFPKGRYRIDHTLYIDSRCSMFVSKTKANVYSKPSFESKKLDELNQYDMVTSTRSYVNAKGEETSTTQYFDDPKRRDKWLKIRPIFVKPPKKLPKWEGWMTADSLVGRAPEGVILQGGGRAQDPWDNAQTQLSWGGSKSEPMLVLQSASAGEINDLAFHAAGDIRDPRATIASECLRLTQPGGGSMYSWIIKGCTFTSAMRHNVLIGEPDPGNPGIGDIQNIAFYNCLFLPANKTLMEILEKRGIQLRTNAHIRQRPRNTYGTALYSCRFDGTRTGDQDTKSPDADYYPLHAVSIQEGTMDFYSIISGSMGFCDIFMDSSYCGITVNSWHSESKNFLMAKIDPNNSFGQLPIVLSGVSHTKDFTRPPLVLKNIYATPPRILPEDPSPVASPYSFSIDWEYIGRGALVLLGCRFSRDIIIRNKESVVFAQGVLFDETSDGSSARPYGIIGNLQNVSGTWFGNEPTDLVNTPPHIIRHH
jgi:pectate lyase-like protein